MARRFSSYLALKEGDFQIYEQYFVWHLLPSTWLADTECPKNEIVPVKYLFCAVSYHMLRNCKVPCPNTSATTGLFLVSKWQQVVSWKKSFMNNHHKVHLYNQVNFFYEIFIFSTPSEIYYFPNMIIVSETILIFLLNLCKIEKLWCNTTEGC